MNLTTDAWIPIVWADGRPGTVSLCGVFERGHEIRDLAVRPHERIALMRLLICIAQAALDGPNDHDDWETCRPKIAPAALDYLRRWHAAFGLFGGGQRFLQVGNLKKPAKEPNGDDDEGSPISKLDLALATGNNTTLFDNAGGAERTFDDGQVALALLAFQCFSPCGTIGVALWSGNPTLGWKSYPNVKSGHSEHGPCVSANMLHCYVRGHNLLESLWSNLITRDQAVRFGGQDAWGRPHWESMPSSPKDRAAVQNATMSYLGRLVPLSRAVGLADDRRSIILANGLEYPAYPEWREPAATIVIRTSKEGPTRAVLRASIDKGTWRELHALTVIGLDKNTNGGPVALANLSNDCDFDLWVGGLVAAGNGKLVDTTQSVFHVPAAMLTEASQMTYERGVKYSGQGESRLRKAISIYRMAMESSERDFEGISRRLAKLKGTEKDRLRHLSAAACTNFWTDVELAVPHLVEIAENPGKLGLHSEWHKTDWGKAVWSAIRAAYEHACPHETPRQIRAYALGLKALFAEPAAKDVAETNEEAET
ncbi:MAG: type I-E CRISPR-associated protein Cse1/CasA [Terriglobia bacterium]|jgi:CRISPR system Cascade subunit CasA